MMPSRDSNSVPVEPSVVTDGARLDVRVEVGLLLQAVADLAAAGGYIGSDQPRFSRRLVDTANELGSSLRTPNFGEWLDPKDSAAQGRMVVALTDDEIKALLWATAPYSDVTELHASSIVGQSVALIRSARAKLRRLPDA